MRVLLVDDHVLFSQSLRFLLMDIDAQLECESASSIAAAQQAKGPFDLILLDYALPDSHGVQGLNRVKQAHAAASIVMVCGETDPRLIRILIDQGASGFVSKASDIEVLLHALRVILSGNVYLPRIARPPEDASSTCLEQLSHRQLRVLYKLVQGKTNKTIADELCISENTVKTHLAAVFRALDVSSRSEAVLKVSTLRLPPSAFVDSV
jgi:DNA-binding NarL/FixJ family response regulator